MKISTLITTGFAIAIGVMTAISAFSIYGTSSSSAGFVNYRTIARHTNLTGELQAHMLMMTIYADKFLISNSEEDYNSYKGYLSEMTTFLEEAKKSITNPERAAMIASMERAVQSYEQGFQNVEEIIKQRNKTKQELFDYGLTMRKALTDLMDSARKDGDTDAAYFGGRLQEHLMLARYYTLEYLKTSSKEDMDRVFTEIGTSVDKLLPDAQKSMKNAGRKALLDTFTGNRSGFTSTFTTLTEQMKKRNDIVFNTMDKVGPEVSKAVADVKLSLKGEQDILGPKLQSRNAFILKAVIVISVIGVLIAVYFAWYIRRGVLRPLGGEPAEMEKIAGQIAVGRLDMTLADEAMATGLYSSMIKMMNNLSDTVSKIRLSSESVASGSTELSSASEELSVTMGDQTSQISSIASAMEEMASSSISVLENIKMIIDKSTGAKTKADEGRVSLGQTSTSMESIRSSAGKLSDTIDSLSESSKKISDILYVINDIADQTNLLALNAAIEAARAGDAGRGFAVVADEVRKLAERTQSAVSEVETIIKSLQTETGTASSNMHLAEQEVQKGVSALQATLEVFGSIAEAIDDVVSANALINTSVTEQNQAIDNVNNSVQAVSAGLEQSASAVREISVTIDDLSRQAEDLNTAVEIFKTK